MSLHQRSASKSRRGKPPDSLPPVSNSTEKIQQLKKIYGAKPKLHTHMYNSDTMPPLANGRLMSASSKVSFAVVPKPAQLSHLGRDEMREMITDLRDELMQSKKQIAKLSQENRVMNTKLNRMTRESERRETHLQNVMWSKYEPAEMKDTQTAMTIATLQKKDVENMQIIRMQGDRIAELQNQVGDSGEFRTDDEEDGRLEDNNAVAETKEKYKKKLIIARAHIEQNKQLKSQIRNLEHELKSLRTKGRSQSPGRTQARVTSAEVNTIMNRIKQSDAWKHVSDGKVIALEAELEQEKLARLEDKEKYEREQSAWEQEKMHVEDERSNWKHAQSAMELELGHYEDVIRSLRQENDSIRHTLVEAKAEIARGNRQISKQDSLPTPVQRPDNVPPLDMTDVTPSSPGEESVNASPVNNVIAKASKADRVALLTETLVSHLSRTIAMSEVM